LPLFRPDRSPIPKVGFQVRDNFFITVRMVRANWPEVPIAFLTDLTSDDARLIEEALIGDMQDDPAVGRWDFIKATLRSESELKIHDLALQLRLQRRWSQIFVTDVSDPSHLTADSQELDPDADLARRCQKQALGLLEQLRRSQHPPQEAPSWDKEACELRYHGEVVRKLRRTAKKPITVLTAFEEDSWPTRIASPLPRNADLREVIRVLNTRLKLLRFEADGSGTGICWKPSSS
jgi:hypothetical protein